MEQSSSPFLFLLRNAHVSEKKNQACYLAGLVVFFSVALLFFSLSLLLSSSFKLRLQSKISADNLQYEQSSTKFFWTHQTLGEQNDLEVPTAAAASLYLVASADSTTEVSVIAD